jgi:hypothetical protein
MHNQLLKEYEYIIMKTKSFYSQDKAIKQLGIPYSSLKILVHFPKDSNHPLLHLKRKKVYKRYNIQKRKDKNIPVNFLLHFSSELSHIFIQ